MIKHWTFRQFAISILLVGATVIAIYDPEMRIRYYEVVVAVITGYFAQMMPQGKE
jgi:hypothetical protein